jgi:class 3 adenylate cyclase
MRLLSGGDQYETRYTKTPDGVFIAYRVTGNGPIDLSWQFDWEGNVDLVWEHPTLGPWFRGLASFSRLILHDRRGTGLSSRNVPPPNIETRAADLRVVLRTIDCERVVLAGAFEGGAVNAMLAAANPTLVHSLVWLEPAARAAWAPDYPWGGGPEYLAGGESALELWGTPEYGRAWADWEAPTSSAEERQFTSILTRHTATPDVARELWRIWWETDIRGVLATVQVPALLAASDEEGHAEEMEHIASLMPDAKTTLLPTFEYGNDVLYLDAIRDFVGIQRPAIELDTVLSTVMFTDIVESTEKQAELGDHGWKDLIENHHALVREALRRWAGVENDTAGDGFYATFDGPARAIRCAEEIRDRVGDIGIEIRAGVHTGECELINDKVGGIAVTIGARISAIAGPSEILISQTVKDLVAGSGLSFEDAGE